MNDPVLNPTKIESLESAITEGSFIRSSVKNGNIFFGRGGLYIV